MCKASRQGVIGSASPPARVPRLLQITPLVPELNQRTEPSARAAFTPPGWKLRAAKMPRPLLIALVPQSGTRVLGGADAKNDVYMAPGVIHELPASNSASARSARVKLEHAVSQSP